MRRYPIMIDLSGRTVVIIGGGRVAARKAAHLLEAGAIVRVVSPRLHDSVPGGVDHVAGTYEPSHLEGATLVFAATDDPEVNGRVVRDARAEKVLVSRADAGDDEPGDFITPARFDDGPITLTVSAGSAALAARLRDEVARRWEPSWTALADCLSRVRPEIVQRSDLTGEQRSRLLRTLASDDSLARFCEQGESGWRTWADTLLAAATADSSAGADKNK